MADFFGYKTTKTAAERIFGYFVSNLVSLQAFAMIRGGTAKTVLEALGIQHHVVPPAGKCPCGKI